MPPDIMAGPAVLGAGPPSGNTVSAAAAGPPGDPSLAALFAALLARSGNPPPRLPQNLSAAKPETKPETKQSDKKTALSSLDDQAAPADAAPTGNAPLPILPPPILPIQMRPLQMRPNTLPIASVTTDQNANQNAMDTVPVSLSPRVKNAENQPGGELPLREARAITSQPRLAFPGLLIPAPVPLVTTSAVPAGLPPALTSAQGLPPIAALPAPSMSAVAAVPTAPPMTAVPVTAAALSTPSVTTLMSALPSARSTAIASPAAVVATAALVLPISLPIQAEVQVTPTAAPATPRLVPLSATFAAPLPVPSASAALPVPSVTALTAPPAVVSPAVVSPSISTVGLLVVLPKAEPLLTAAVPALSQASLQTAPFAPLAAAPLPQGETLTPVSSGWPKTFPFPSTGKEQAAESNGAAAQNRPAPIPVPTPSNPGKGKSSPAPAPSVAAAQDAGVATQGSDVRFVVTPHVFFVPVQALTEPTLPLAAPKMPAISAPPVSAAPEIQSSAAILPAAPAVHAALAAAPATLTVSLSAISQSLPQGAASPAVAARAASPASLPLTSLPLTSLPLALPQAALSRAFSPVTLRVAAAPLSAPLSIALGTPVVTALPALPTPNGQMVSEAKVGAKDDSIGSSPVLPAAPTGQPMQPAVSGTEKQLENTLKTAPAFADNNTSNTVTRNVTPGGSPIPAAAATGLVALRLQVIGKRSDRQSESVLPETPKPETPKSDATQTGAVTPAPTLMTAAPENAAPTAPLTRAERAEMIQQAAEGIKAMPPPSKTGAAEQMTLQLHPKDWGQLQISVRLATPTHLDAAQAQTVTAHIIAASPQVKAALENHSGELRQALHEAGLTLDRLTVTVQAPSAAGQAGTASSGGHHLMNNGSGLAQSQADQQMDQRGSGGNSPSAGLSSFAGTSSGAGGMGPQGGRQGGQQPAYAAYAPPEQSQEEMSPWDAPRRPTHSQLDMRA